MVSRTQIKWDAQLIFKDFEDKDVQKIALYFCKQEEPKGEVHFFSKEIYI